MNAIVVSSIPFKGNALFLYHRFGKETYIIVYLYYILTWKQNLYLLLVLTYPIYHFYYIYNIKTYLFYNWNVLYICDVDPQLAKDFLSILVVFLFIIFLRQLFICLCISRCPEIFKCLLFVFVYILLQITFFILFIYTLIRESKTLYIVVHRLH